MAVSSPDFYEVLDVPPRADRTTLARAWRTKRDRVDALRGRLRHDDAEALCAKLDEAFSILSNPRREDRYLEYLRSQRGAEPGAAFAGLEFDAAGSARGRGPDTLERHKVLEALLDPPEPVDAPWATPEQPRRDSALSSPSTEWELEAPPGSFAPPASRSAVRPNLEAASRARGVRAGRSAADERLLKALTAPPWGP